MKTAKLTSLACLLAGALLLSTACQMPGLSAPCLQEKDCERFPVNANR